MRDAVSEETGSRNNDSDGPGNREERRIAAPDGQAALSAAAPDLSLSIQPWGNAI
jgi:hypothetical protein